MFSWIMRKLVGTKNQREIKRISPMLERINALEPKFKKKTPDQLKAKTAEFYGRVDKGESLDDLLPEAFALVREASLRVLEMRHFDMQLLGGMVLHEGKIAEMKTGEGKTLVATLPLYLNALARKGCHLITVNDYLARRDAEWMGKIYSYLGMDVGVIVHDLSDAQRKASYGAHITYGTNNEFGFDYLRDNMKFSLEDYVQRPLNFAIVDEVDSILIDEARTPLIISGPSEESSEKYYRINAIIPFLKKDVDFSIDEKANTVVLTEAGVEKVEHKLKVDNLFDPRNIELLHHVNQGLRAHHLYKRDVQYIVKDGQVVIVDEFTGRLMPGRRWSDGLHQAVEAKENVKIESENQTLATVTFQNFFRLYKKLAGMTGTAETEAGEFSATYKLDVIVVPTHRNMIRIDNQDVVYKTEREKFRAIIEEIAERHHNGQPSLVGTVSVEKSEVLSKMLAKKGVPHHVLNAKQHEREAEIIAQAGRKGAVTISTNMAGRGTDILLGGNPEFLAKGRASEGSPEWGEAMTHFKGVCAKEREAVIAAGGLHVIGTERHEARRIDNQLRGRSGRQGDPGSSHFYLSLEDDLMRIFGGERISGIMDRLGMQENEPIEHKFVTRAIENAQKKVEGHHFDSRKHLLEYDDVMDKQRKAVYGLRLRILGGDNIFEDKEARSIISDTTSAIVERNLPANGEGGDGAVQKLKAEIQEAFRVDMDPSAIDFGRLKAEEIMANVEARCLECYDQRDSNPEIHQAFYSIFRREWSLNMVDELVSDTVERYCSANIHVEEWDLNALSDAIYQQFNLRVELESVEMRLEAIAKAVFDAVERTFEARERDLGRDLMRYLERVLHLQEIDTLWREQLVSMDSLKEGIGLRGYGQKDPKKEYAREGYAMFEEMMGRVSVNMINKLFRVQLQSEEDVQQFRPRRRRMEMRRGGEEAEKPTTVRNKIKVGRNDPCPCGSGKKYKKCCLLKGEDQTAA